MQILRLDCTHLCSRSYVCLLLTLWLGQASLCLSLFNCKMGNDSCIYLLNCSKRHNTGKVHTVHLKTCWLLSPRRATAYWWRWEVHSTHPSYNLGRNKKPVSGKAFPVFDYKAKPEEILRIKSPNPASCPSTVPSVYWLHVPLRTFIYSSTFYRPHPNPHGVQGLLGSQTLNQHASLCLKE